MKVLLIKTSSMGDIIHTLPALTDAKKELPTIQFDWVIEESLAQIPLWHFAVSRVIPVAWRRWRKKFFSLQHYQQYKKFFHQLREQDYDLILDAQGLVKSAVLTWLGRGRRCGLDWQSAREHGASLFYQRRCTVNFHQHAVRRMRELFAKALYYPLPSHIPDYGLQKLELTYAGLTSPYVVFVHGTTWESKLWPLSYWQKLADQLTTHGFTIYIPWGNEDEKQRALQIAQQKNNIIVLPQLTLNELVGVIRLAKAVVAVDTGFGHLAAALAVPCVSLYGPTDPKDVGALGFNQAHLAAKFICAPCRQRQCTYQQSSLVHPACFEQITPNLVWQSLQQFL